ncbi:MAG: DUF655 domain-containing protein [Candidatus Micrarchaeia archaeon]
MEDEERRFDKQMEEYAYILDFLPYGKPDDPRRQPVVQLIGESFFTLLEAYPKVGKTPGVGERTYVGKGDRDVIGSIRGRISYDELTSTSKNSLHEIIIKIIMAREKEFVDFINRCGPINIHVHQLELIPGIGKKLMQAILDERAKAPFQSFSDIEKRVHISRIPEFLAQRIEDELKKSKYYLFVRPAKYR